MVRYITHLKDVLGNNYLGINIDKSSIDKYLEELKEILGDEFETYTNKQKERDHNEYHITLINVMDYNRLHREMGLDKFVNSLDPIFKYPIDDIKMLGIGRAQRGENTAYFVVCKSEKLDTIRKHYGLGEQHFHITLGFKWKDVFGIPKNILYNKESKFISVLRSEYSKKMNFDFVRSIKNYNLGKSSEIIPISIDETKLKVAVDGNYLVIGLIEDQLRITNEYSIGDKLPRLSESEISRILKKE